MVCGSGLAIPTPRYQGATPTLLFLFPGYEFLDSVLEKSIFHYEDLAVLHHCSYCNSGSRRILLLDYFYAANVLRRLQPVTREWRRANCARAHRDTALRLPKVIGNRE